MQIIPNIPLLIETSFLEIKFLDILDIAMVATLFYVVFRLIKGTSAFRIFVGIISFYFIWKIVELLQMEMLSEIFGSFIQVGVIALIIVFQQEIRRFLLLLGSPGFFNKNARKIMFWRIARESQTKSDIHAVIKSCRNMSKTNTGALIVLSRDSELQEYINRGDLIDARLTDVMLESIFFKNSPLHDGAVIIRSNRIQAARCILPLTDRTDLPGDYGLRHRAALGLSEQSDALCLIVSEETGKISIAIDGQLKTDLSIENIRKSLEEHIRE